MSTKELLLEELHNAPDAMVTEALDFVRFLKSSRYAPERIAPESTDDQIDVIFDHPRTIHDLANEQKAFLASLPVTLIDIDLPCED